MKNWIKLAGLVAGTAALAACGNSGLLSSLGLDGSGANETSAAQQAAIEELAMNWCDSCPTPDGGATELTADVRPEEYSGLEPIELSLRITDPAGVVDATGAVRVDRFFSMNDFDFVAALPAEAWKVSADGTVMRVVLYSSEPLPEGVYHAHGAIKDGEHEASDSETYEVGNHEEPTPTATEQPHDSPTPEPTATPHDSPTPEPTATPTNPI